MVKDAVKDVVEEVAMDAHSYVIEVAHAIVNFDCRIDSSYQFNLASLCEDSFDFQVVAKSVVTWL